jgi:NAD(P)-dependent dehydrogenase (short-subunit alcohol dehydrogenase family)
MLRPGLLEGVAVLLAGAGDSPSSTIGSTLAELGASVSVWKPAAPESSDSQAEPAAKDVDLLVIDAAAMFAGADGSQGERDASQATLRACLDGSWQATQAVATAAFIEPKRAGRVVYLAPAPNAGAHADAARAGLENLARTLSIEWARYAITTVTIAPGTDTSQQQLAALTAYLASPAGAYFSGCLLDLRGAGGEAR